MATSMKESKLYEQDFYSKVFKAKKDLDLQCVTYDGIKAILKDYEKTVKFDENKLMGLISYVVMDEKYSMIIDFKQDKKNPKHYTAKVHTEYGTLSFKEANEEVQTVGAALGATVSQIGGTLKDGTVGTVKEAFGASHIVPFKAYYMIPGIGLILKTLAEYKYRKSLAADCSKVFDDIIAKLS